MAISTKFTHADLLTYPEDGKRREIINGDMFVTPTPRISHQRIVQRLARAFEAYLDKHLLGEVFYTSLDVIFTEYDVLEPDLLFVASERREILQDWVRGAPDLVAEVLSPTTASRDRGVKLRAYARFGVQEYWIVDPVAQAIEAYRLTPEGYELVRTFQQTDTLTSALLPEFALPVSAVFKT